MIKFDELFYGSAILLSIVYFSCSLDVFAIIVGLTEASWVLYGILYYGSK